MSVEKVKQFFKEHGADNMVIELGESCATVELAANALGCESSRIAKTLSFHVGDRVVLVVASGDTKIDNAKYKAQFGTKAKMLSFDEAEPLIGHAVGGVCPFAVNDGVEVYLDKSMQRFDVIYPACGSSNSLAQMTLKQLEEYSNYISWVDVCKLAE